jgi:phage terminase large subunit
MTHDPDSKAFKFWRENPVRAVQDWFNASPEDYQAQALNDLFCSGKNRTAIKSAHGVGKTTINAWAGIIFLMTRKFSRVVMTAPVQAQLKDVLIPEYAKWIAKMPPEWANMWSVSAEHIRYKPKVNGVDVSNLWFAVARTSNKRENLQGFHGEHMLLQCDEASGVPDPVFEVVEGALSEAEEKGTECILMMTGNPNFTAGELYNAFTRNKELYNCITVSGDPEATPRATGEDGTWFYSPRVKQKYRDTMAKKYGKDGAIYDVRVRGQFPRSGDDVVIPFEWAQRAASVPTPAYDHHSDPVTIVMDVARFGGDETVVASFRKGHCIRMQHWPKTSTERCVDILRDEHIYWQNQSIVVERCIVDEPGVGGGVIDSARRAALNITPYNGGGSLNPDRDPKDDCRMFANRRSRDWWMLRRKMELGVISIPEDDVLIAQLASVKFDYNQQEKIQVESKKKMRERLGDEASPDRADTIVMGAAPWYTLISAVTTVTMADLLVGRDRPQPELDLW